MSDPTGSLADPVAFERLAQAKHDVVENEILSDPTGSLADPIVFDGSLVQNLNFLAYPCINIYY